jgi:hypothetical protein
MSRSIVLTTEHGSRQGVTDIVRPGDMTECALATSAHSYGDKSRTSGTRPSRAANRMSHRRHSDLQIRWKVSERSAGAAGIGLSWGLSRSGRHPTSGVGLI